MKLHKVIVLLEYMSTVMCFIREIKQIITNIIIPMLPALSSPHVFKTSGSLIEITRKLS